MHPEDIKAELRKRYGSMTNLADRWGYAPGALTTAIARSNASVRLEMLIAKAIGLTPYEIWPQRWTADGIPLPRGTDQFATRKLEKAKQQTVEAA
jgi:Ner family transcriptional regulator